MHYGVRPVRGARANSRQSFRWAQGACAAVRELYDRSPSEGETCKSARYRQGCAIHRAARSLRLAFPPFAGMSQGWAFHLLPRSQAFIPESVPRRRRFNSSSLYEGRHLRPRLHANERARTAPRKFVQHAGGGSMSPAIKRLMQRRCACGASGAPADVRSPSGTAAEFRRWTPSLPPPRRSGEVGNPACRLSALAVSRGSAP